jgi:hypothetical protein
MLMPLQRLSGLPQGLSFGFMVGRSGRLNLEVDSMSVDRLHPPSLEQIRRF